MSNLVTVSATREEVVHFDITAAEAVRGVKNAFLTKLFGDWRKGVALDDYDLVGNYWVYKDSTSQWPPIVQTIREAHPDEIKIWEAIKLLRDEFNESE